MRLLKSIVHRSDPTNRTARFYREQGGKRPGGGDDPWIVTAPVVDASDESEGSGVVGELIEEGVGGEQVGDHLVDASAAVEDPHRAGSLLGGGGGAEELLIEEADEGGFTR